MNAPHDITEPTLEDLKREVQALKVRNATLLDRNLALSEMVTDLQEVVEDLKAEIQEAISERNLLRRTAPARLLKEAVIEYRELVQEGEANKDVWMGVESHLDRALEQIRA